MQTDFGQFRAVAATPRTAGEKVWLGFRPEAVEIGPHEVNSFATRISHVSYLGEIEQYGLEIAPGQTIKAFEQNPREIRQVGAPLTVHVRPQNFLVLPQT